MAAMEWDDPGMKRNKNVRFRMGQGSNTVSYYPPQSALDVGRNPSGYNPNQVPAVRQSGLPSVTSRGGLPSVVPHQTGFQMGAGSPVEISSVARPAAPQLQIGHNQLEQITSEEVQRNLGRNRPRSSAPVSDGTTSKASFKSMGPFNSNTRVSGGSHVIDPSGSLAGELYRRLSKSTGRYIPGLEQMWGGQPNADEWRQGADDAYQQARSGLKVNPMTTNRAAGIPALPAQPPNPVLSKFSNGMDATPENAKRAIELGLPGAVAANEAMNPERPVYGETPGSGYIYGGRDFMAKGSGPATGGFSRPSTADANLAFEDEQNRLVAEQSRQDQLRREYNDELQGQRNFDGNINWALNNPKAPGAAVFLAQLQQGRKIGQQVTPLSDRQSNLYKAQSEGFSKEAAGQNQLAEARTRQTALPYIGPKAKAETSLQNAQAEYYAGKNATDRGNSMYEGYVKTLIEKMKSSGTKALSATDWKALSDLQMTNPEMYAQAMADLKRQG